MLLSLLNYSTLHWVVYLLLLSPLIAALCLGYRFNYSWCNYDTPQRLIKSFIFLFIFYVGVLVSAAWCFLYYQNVNFLHSWAAGTWFSTASYTIFWSFVIDPLSIGMFFIVIGVSGFVHFYSLAYMKSDPNLLKFLAYLSLFTFFMLVLVCAGNLVQLFIGWEGVGLCSFLLISFWTERAAANKAAVKAMVVNKIGDCFILLGIALLLQTSGSGDFSAPLFYSFADYTAYGLFSLIGLSTYYFSFFVDGAAVICFFLFLGVMAKSAQFGFHTWLPDAMEGPTPVSALIHAATMVTAGVFLLLRLSFLFTLAPGVQQFILCIGLLTMVFAASVALFQNDIKRVIAYSTCSQLGYMVAACGLSFYGVAFFHLLTHAFFKALLFLGAGAVIHFFNDEQDMRKMGGAYYYNPVAFICMVVASFSLLGFPFTSGYYSKDWLLELFFVGETDYSWFVYMLGIFVALLTAFYSFRLLFLVFLNPPSGHWSAYFFPHSEDRKISLVLVGLLVFTMFFGYIFKTFYGTALFFSGDAASTYNLAVPLYVKLFPLVVLLIGGLLAYYIVFANTQSWIFPSKGLHGVYDFLVKRWYLDFFFNVYFTRPVFYFARFSFLNIEKGWIEFFGPSGGTQVLFLLSKKINGMQTLNFMEYAAYFFFFLSFLSFAFKFGLFV